MTYVLRSADPTKSRADALVVGVVSGKKGPLLVDTSELLGPTLATSLPALAAALHITGKVDEVIKAPAPAGVKATTVVFVGLGAPQASWTDQAQVNAVRRAAGVAARATSSAATITVALPAETAGLVAAIVHGHALGGYAFTAYKSKAPQAVEQSVTIATKGARRVDVLTAATDAERLAAATATVRDWVNTPPGDKTPPALAGFAVAAAKGIPKVKVTVHDEKALAELGFGGTLSVGTSSVAPPRLVELVYSPPKPVAHLALVGKGITFDTGGYTIKPGNSMDTMKSDMAGAATVIQATLLIAQLGLPIKVSTFAPMAENMVSGSASRPGDIVTMYGGTTVEITNTDAEGRMLLGDALIRAAEAKPDVILDVATLTGHMVMALGDRITGVMGGDTTVEAVLAAAERAGEPMWPMPIPPSMPERIRSSKIADLSQHDWIRWGGGLYAAAFLREFTGGLPWAHLDIAGPSFVSAPHGHVTAGGTGVALATLVEFARTLSAKM